MAGIPITFEYKGKEYKGHFDEVAGAGGKMWHLTINRFHFGQLICTTNYGFQFHSNKGHFEDMADFFGEHMIVWYQ